MRRAFAFGFTVGFTSLILTVFGIREILKSYYQAGIE
jgi:hypothetical protein